MSVSSWMLERNRDLAQLVFGPADGPPVPAAMRRDDERKAAGLTPFIIATAAGAALGGRLGLDRKQRTALAGISALLFLAI